MTLREIAELRAAPNQLTLLRLCVIPFIVLAILAGCVGAIVHTSLG